MANADRTRSRNWPEIEFQPHEKQQEDQAQFAQNAEDLAARRDRRAGSILPDRAARNRTVPRAVPLRFHRPQRAAPMARQIPAQDTCGQHHHQQLDQDDAQQMLGACRAAARRQTREAGHREKR